MEKHLTMEDYQNHGGKSSVARYLPNTNHITVEFSTGDVRFYKYTYESAGKETVEHMKQLAEQGVGLNSFINHNAKQLYESKW